MEPMRDDPGMRAIARLWARLDAYRRDELVQLLSPEALDDLHPVQRLMADPEGPVQTRALALSAVTWFHWCRYHLLTGERAERELRMALAAGAQAAAVSPALVPPDALARVRSGSLLADPAIEADRAGRRVTLAGQTGDQTALNEALASLARAVAQMPADSPDLVPLRAQLANGWRDRCRATGDVRSADRAVEVGTALVEDLPDTHPLLPSLLSDLAMSHLARFDLTRGPQDLAAAVAAAERSSRLPADSPGEQARLDSNAAIVHSRSQSRGEAAHGSALERALALGRAAVESTASDHADRAGRLTNLGRDLFFEHLRTRAREPLDEAVTHLTQALRLSAADSPYLTLQHSILAGCLLARHTVTSARADLDAAIEHQRSALAELPRSSRPAPDPAGVSGQLAGMLRHRFELTGELDDLEEAMLLEEGRSPG